MILRISKPVFANARLSSKITLEINNEFSQQQTHTIELGFVNKLCFQTKTNPNLMLV